MGVREPAIPSTIAMWGGTVKWGGHEATLLLLLPRLGSTQQLSHRPQLSTGMCHLPPPHAMPGAVPPARPWPGRSPGRAGGGRDAAGTTQGGLALLQHREHLLDRSDQDPGTRSVCPAAPWLLLVLKPPHVITHVPEATTPIAARSRFLDRYILAPPASKHRLVPQGRGYALGVRVVEGRRTQFSAFWVQTVAAAPALQHWPRWHSPAVLHARRDRQPLQSLNYSARAGPIC